MLTPTYTDAERDVLNRARPLLISAFRAPIEHHSLRQSFAELGGTTAFAAVLEAAGLTAREAQVVHLVALGNSNRDVAGELGGSDRTVGKHLEHAFRELQVRTRSEAAVRAWALVRALGDAAEQDAIQQSDWANMRNKTNTPAQEMIAELNRQLQAAR